MKKYIKPNVLIVRVKVEKLLQYSLKSVGGLGDDVKKGDGFFSGGTADSRRNRYWDDEEDEFDF